MDNYEHYMQFLDYLRMTEAENRDVKEVLLKTANTLATQNYVIIEKLEAILETIKNK